MTEKQKEKFIVSYLQERGILKNKPDGVTYYNGKTIAKYYMNQGKDKICFILNTLDQIPGYECVRYTLCEAHNMRLLFYVLYNNFLNKGIFLKT